MSAPSGETVPVRSLSSRIRKFQGSVYIAGGEQAFELDEIAVFVYRQVDGVRSLADIGAVLAQEYGIDVDTATEDVTELLTALAEHRVVEFRDRTSNTNGGAG